ncbi:globin, protozoan/cyanobacterial family [Leptospira fainei serovar Hurstbridge str. BUT 6]|uniref:Globin, protozoan/cyanobacterial family n=1 Tax=Leptospira fainei serovar Hurstbridge str. BUT 6 TaxID=1193011 RepID=S3UXT2_9LEPT|nr:globin [Leptospira fainei]EPG74018.1 globin, protozoan/cyanobacterial family [Leptospira fainei serovar Hurstbridge str. BUT 6]
MSEHSIHIPPSGPPAPDPRLRTLFLKLGEEKLRSLVADFYRKIPSSPIAWMFPENLEHSIQKSADFLIQVVGGPPYYVERYGAPRMRARHLPFPIDEKSRRAWLSCYREAIQDWEVDQESKDIIWEFLQGFSAWMVNTA